MTSWMNGDELGLNIESAARLERRTSELERWMIVLIEKGTIDEFQTVTVHLDELDLGRFQQNRAN